MSGTGTFASQLTAKGRRDGRLPLSTAVPHGHGPSNAHLPGSVYSGSGRLQVRADTRQYATSDVVAALLKEAREGTRNRAGYRDVTCSPFEEDEIAILEHRPAATHRRSTSPLSTPPASDAEDDSGDGNSGQSGEPEPKRQRTTKSHATRGAVAGPGPSTARNRARRGRSRGGI